MIQRFGDYETTQAYGDFQKLPKGGYELKIYNVKQESGNYGAYLVISFDIEAGDYYHYYAKDYKNQQSEEKKWRGKYLLNVPNDDGSDKDNWTKRRFKTFTTALEDSNPGYHFDWDEQKFKNKVIGGLFNEREFEASNGEVKRATNLAAVCSIEKIRSGDYTIPEDKLLKKATASTSGFMDIPEGAGEELPFA